MKKQQKVLFALLAIFVFGVVVSPGVFAKKEGDNSANAKSEKVKELKNYEKPTKEKTNAVIYKEKINKVSDNLTEIAETEKNKGQQNREEKTSENRINNPESGQQEKERVKTREQIVEELEDVAGQAESVQDETVTAIEAVEKQDKVKKFLVGTDYKNLGQLRSSLVHNRNQIRKLTQLAEGVTDEGLKVAIQEQLTILMQERERIKMVISENEGGFSLLGWAFKFMNGYANDSIDEQQETALENEVVAVLDDTTEEVVEDEGENTQGEVIVTDEIQPVVKNEVEEEL